MSALGRVIDRGSARRVLRVASCMAPNADDMCRRLAVYVGRSLGLSVAVVDAVDWRDRERLLDAGEVDLCWICGLPYVEKAEVGRAIELCVAPVMHGARYGARPVYFSDIVVRRDSRYMRFEDLRGASVSYNERRSHSGYGVLAFHLAGLGETFQYFERMFEAGSHQRSLELILSERVAAAAIDTTVLEAETRKRPGLRQALRSIETIGPSPAPPWVLSTALPPELRHETTACLSSMHESPEGAEVLASWGVAELRRVTDADYDPLRRMARFATAARPEHGHAGQARLSCSW